MQSELTKSLYMLEFTITDSSKYSDFKVDVRRPEREQYLVCDEISELPNTAFCLVKTGQEPKGGSLVRKVNRVLKDQYGAPEYTKGGFFGWIRAKCLKRNLSELEKWALNDSRVGYTVWTENDWVYSRIHVLGLAMVKELQEDFLKACSYNKETVDSLYSPIVNEPIVDRVMNNPAILHNCESGETKSV